jgi:hypothetical protein
VTLNLSGKEFRDLYTLGATPWEILLYAYLKDAGADVAPAAVSCEDLERELLLPSSSQTRLLKRLAARKLATVHYESQARPTPGGAARMVKLLKATRPAPPRSSAAPKTGRKSTMRST